MRKSKEIDRETSMFLAGEVVKVIDTFTAMLGLNLIYKHRKLRKLHEVKGHLIDLIKYGGLIKIEMPDLKNPDKYDSTTTIKNMDRVYQEKLRTIWGKSLDANNMDEFLDHFDIKIFLKHYGDFTEDQFMKKHGQNEKIQS